MFNSKKHLNAEQGNGGIEEKSTDHNKISDMPQSISPFSTRIGFLLGKPPALFTQTYPTLYRGDAKDFNHVFNKGFTALGTNTDLLQHLIPTRESFYFKASAYIPTSLSKEVAAQFPQPLPADINCSYLYEIETKRPAINAVEKLEKILPQDVIDFNRGLQERLILSKIEPHEIKGCWKVNIYKNLIGIEFDKAYELKMRHIQESSFITNPNFVSPTYPEMKLWNVGKLAGYSLTFVGATFDALSLNHEYQISKKTGNYDNTYQEGSRLVGAWAGALATGSVFAEMGAAYCIPFAPYGPPVCGFVGGLIGSAVGYYTGSEAGTKIYDIARNGPKNVSQSPINPSFSISGLYSFIENISLISSANASAPQPIFEDNKINHPSLESQDNVSMKSSRAMPRLQPSLSSQSHSILTALERNVPVKAKEEKKPQSTIPSDIIVSGEVTIHPGVERFFNNWAMPPAFFQQFSSEVKGSLNNIFTKFESIERENIAEKTHLAANQTCNNIAEIATFVPGKPGKVLSALAVGSNAALQLNTALPQLGAQLGVAIPALSALSPAMAFLAPATSILSSIGGLLRRKRHHKSGGLDLSPLVHNQQAILQNQSVIIGNQQVMMKGIQVVSHACQEIYGACQEIHDAVIESKLEMRDHFKQNFKNQMIMLQSILKMAEFIEKDFKLPVMTSLMKLEEDVSKLQIISSSEHGNMHLKSLRKYIHLLSSYLDGSAKIKNDAFIKLLMKLHHWAVNESCMPMLNGAIHLESSHKEDNLLSVLPILTSPENNIENLLGYLAGKAEQLTKTKLPGIDITKLMNANVWNDAVSSYLDGLAAVNPKNYNARHHLDDIIDQANNFTKFIDYLSGNNNLYKKLVSLYNKTISEINKLIQAKMTGNKFDISNLQYQTKVTVNDLFVRKTPEGEMLEEYLDKINALYLLLTIYTYLGGIKEIHEDLKRHLLTKEKILTTVCWHCSTTGDQPLSISDAESCRRFHYIPSCKIKLLPITNQNLLPIIYGESHPGLKNVSIFNLEDNSMYNVSTKDDYWNAISLHMKAQEWPSPNDKNWVLAIDEHKSIHFVFSEKDGIEMVCNDLHSMTTRKLESLKLNRHAGNPDIRTQLITKDGENYIAALMFNNKIGLEIHLYKLLEDKWDPNTIVIPKFNTRFSHHVELTTVNDAGGHQDLLLVCSNKNLQTCCWRFNLSFLLPLQKPFYNQLVSKEELADSKHYQPCEIASVVAFIKAHAELRKAAECQREFLALEGEKEITEADLNHDNIEQQRIASISEAHEQLKTCYQSIEDKLVLTMLKNHSNMIDFCVLTWSENGNVLDRERKLRLLKSIVTAFGSINVELTGLKEKIDYNPRQIKEIIEQITSLFSQDEKSLKGKNNKGDSALLAKSLFKLNESGKPTAIEKAASLDAYPF